MSDERPRVTRIDLPSNRDLLLRMLDETTRFLNAAEPLRDALLTARRMLQDEAVQSEVESASRDLEPILKGRSPWAALGEIEGRYLAVDRLADAVRRTARLTEDLTTNYLPLTGRGIEVSGFPENLEDWIADMRAGGKLFGSFVAAVREAHDAIFAKLAASPCAPEADAPPTLPDLVTLNQAAASVSRRKRTLERRKTQGTLPPPCVEGGGGKPDLWNWSVLRPWLIKEFGVNLPERFPANR